MKKWYMIMALILISGGLFAAGKADDAQKFPQDPQSVWENAQELNLSGTLEFDKNGIPLLNVDGETYALQIPGFRMWNAEDFVGEALTIEGKLLQRPEYTPGRNSPWNQEYDQFLWVSKLTYKGKSLEIFEGGMGYYHGGRRGGPGMMGSGRGFGGSTGPGPGQNGMGPRF